MPIIALSAMVSAEAIERGRAVGFHDFVAKFDRAGLIAAIKEQSAELSRRREQREAAMNDNVQTLTEYVTFTIAGQLFGLPIARVQDVFKPARMTRVPLAGAGDRRRAQSARPHRHGHRYAQPARPADARRRPRRRWRSASKSRGELFGLLVDAVGEVLKLPDTRARAQSDQSRPQARRACPPASTGSTAQLLVVLDIDRVLDLRAEAVAA